MKIYHDFKLRLHTYFTKTSLKFEYFIERDVGKISPPLTLVQVLTVFYLSANLLFGIESKNQSIHT